MNKSLAFFCIACFPFFFLVPACQSAPAPSTTVSGMSRAVALSGKTDSSQTETVTPSSVTNSGGTLLAVPSKEMLRKNTLDPAVLAFLETGSPDGIRQAVERINADPRGMTDKNRVVLAVSAELMKTLYPLETVSWSIPSVPETDPYVSIIRSAHMGVYDYNSGNADFLSVVLPSIVLAVSPNPGEYYADAEAALKKASFMNTKSVLPPLFLAFLAERQGKTSVSDNYYHQAWELDSSCYPAGVGYVRSLIRNDKGSVAISVARQLAARYPASVQMTKLCADAAFSSGDWNAADPYILSILKADPDNTDYLLMRARILIERKDYLKANSLLDAFATRNRTDKNYLLLRSRVVREWNRNPVSASGFLQDAQRLYPEDTDVLLASAEVCYQTGQTINKKSGRDFVWMVLGKNPGNPAALALLVNDSILSGDWANAVRYGEQLVSSSSTDSSRSLLARAYLGAGQGAKAVSLARGLYAASPSEENTGLYLQSLIDTGDTRTAGTIISAGMGDASSSLKSVLHFYESRMTSSPEARLSALRSSLLSDPRNQQSLFAMYEWYYERSDYRKAQYYLKQVIALDPSNKRYIQLQSKLDELLAR